MSSQIYHIPTIPPDLWREDAILQIADTLLYLNKVTDDTFSRISKRVDDIHHRLASVNDRVSLARAKVSKLQGSNKATKVFASAKYPSPEFLEEYESVFKHQNSLKNIPKSHVKLQQNKPMVVDEKVLKEKLQYYNVHLNVKSKQRDDEGEGLGRLPRNIPSISSLLLFNTTENPYKKYVMLDPLGIITKTRQDIGEDGQNGLTEAPSSIAQNEEIKRQVADNYFYVPTIGLVPEIMAPSSLPDLTGVADDESFLADQGPSIAPSVPSSVPDLPSISSHDSEIPMGPAASSPASGALSSAAAPPPPPPPPPPAVAPPPPPAAAPPPPPPPPPPPSETPAPPPPPPTAAADSDEDTTPASKAPAPSSGNSGDTWGDLLKSIREAGGAGKAKLKKAKEGKVEKKKKKKNDEDIDTDDLGASAGSGGGDLMADLTKKLMMRRRGIMGSLSQGGGGGGGGGSSKEKDPPTGNVMDKISAMIAPPPPKAGDDDDERSDSDFD